MARFYSFSPVPPNNTACIIYLKNYPNQPIPAVWKSTKKQFLEHKRFIVRIGFCFVLHNRLKYYHYGNLENNF